MIIIQFSMSKIEQVVRKLTVSVENPQEGTSASIDYLSQCFYMSIDHVQVIP